MNRASISTPVVAVIAVLGASLGASLGGCAVDGGDEGIFVLKNVHADAGCVTTVAQTELGISHGNLDLVIPGGYLFIAQLKSRITALAGQEDQRTIILSGANVDISFPGSTVFSDAELADLKAKALTRFKRPFSGPLTPNGGLTDVGFELIPGELVERIRAKVPDLTQRFRLEAAVSFTVEGTMAGGTVTSQPYSYSVTIGNFVTINLAGLCPLPKDFGTPRPGYVCNPYQDGVVDCCGTSPDNLQCPATVSTM
jgi:hypothetical protein